MRRLRLWPQGVVGQIIILVALALFVAQAINFTLLLRERQRIELTAQTAPGVFRIDVRRDHVDHGPQHIALMRKRVLQAATFAGVIGAGAIGHGFEAGFGQVHMARNGEEARN